MTSAICFYLDQSKILLSGNGLILVILSVFHRTIYSVSQFSELLKVALQILGRKFYKNTKKSSFYSQSLLIFIHRTPLVERRPIKREIRDLLRPRSTPMGNTVYFYMSRTFIYTLKIHRRSFKHSVR